MLYIYIQIVNNPLADTSQTNSGLPQCSLNSDMEFEQQYEIQLKLLQAVKNCQAVIAQSEDYGAIPF